MSSAKVQGTLETHRTEVTPAPATFWNGRRVALLAAGIMALAISAGIVAALLPQARLYAIPTAGGLSAIAAVVVAVYLCTRKNSRPQVQHHTTSMSMAGRVRKEHHPKTTTPPQSHPPLKRQWSRPLDGEEIKFTREQKVRNFLADLGIGSTAATEGPPSFWANF